MPGFHGHPNYEFLEGKSCRCIISIDRRKRKGMLAYLAVPSVAMVEPLKKAVLVNELDATAAGAWITQWIVRISRVPADPAHITFVLILVVPIGRCGKHGRWNRRRRQ